jgi:GDP-D-mannose dehydratase
MNEEDLWHCAALMKIITGASPKECYKFADEFIEASKEEPDNEEGIVAIKPKRKYVKRT